MAYTLYSCSQSSNETIHLNVMTGEWGGVSGSLEDSGVLTNVILRKTLSMGLQLADRLSNNLNIVLHRPLTLAKAACICYAHIIFYITYQNVIARRLVPHKVLFKSALGLSFSLVAILVSSFSEVSPLHLIYWNADT